MALSSEHPALGTPYTFNLLMLKSLTILDGFVLTTPGRTGICYFLSYRWEAEVEKKTEADISNNLCSSVPTDFSECLCKCYFMCTLTFWHLAGTMFLVTLSFKNEICSLTSLYTERESTLKMMVFPILRLL